MDSRAASLGQADRDRLLRRSRAVFALADMIHFFAHEFSGLGAWSFALALILARPCDRFLFRHAYLREYDCNSPAELRTQRFASVPEKLFEP